MNKINKLSISLFLSLNGCAIKEYHKVKCNSIGAREVTHCFPYNGGMVCYRTVAPIYRCH
jgi:hypothetical protein